MSLVATILHTLLDRWEQPQRQQVVRVRLSKRQHAAYFSTQDAAPRTESNRTLQTLEARGWLALHWVKWERGNWLQAVDLLPDAAPALYEYLGRAPRDAQAEALRARLAAQVGRAPWHGAFLQWAEAQLAAHRSVAPLELGDDAHNRDLLLMLDGVAALRQPTLERTLSVRLFGESKRLATLRPALLTVLRRHSAHADAYAGDEAALLRAHHLDRVPEYLPLAGPLQLALPRAMLDLAPFAPSVALSAATVRAATVAACPARALVTIENGTSFSEWVSQGDQGVVTLFTGGFASPTAIALLQAIRHAAPALPLFHWGDLDAGGLRILAHLRGQLGPIHPLAMDPATFEAHRHHARPLTASDRAALAALRDHPHLLDCRPLIDCLLAADQKLEQEAIEATTAQATLGVA